MLRNSESGQEMAGMAADARAGEPRKRPLLSKIPDWVVFLSFYALFLTLTVLSVREKSATWDETAHLPVGVSAPEIRGVWL